MMKKYGYRPSMAGAIEATASSAGQIMPPVLGLAAFMIASFLNKPYIDVALSALIPALLYLAGVGIGIIVYARRFRLPRLEEYADSRMILRLLQTRSEEHTSELQSLMRTSYAVFCLKKKNIQYDKCNHLIYLNP